MAEKYTGLPTTREETRNARGAIKLFFFLATNWSLRAVRRTPMRVERTRTIERSPRISARAVESQYRIFLGPLQNARTILDDCSLYFAAR